MHTQDLLIRNFDVDCFAGALLPGSPSKIMTLGKPMVFQWVNQWFVDSGKFPNEQTIGLLSICRITVLIH